jgi:hypothetical protein
MEEKNHKQPFWRQGDIYFVKLDRDFDTKEAVTVKDGVIARGEMTGHSHRVSQSSLAAGAALYHFGRALYLRAEKAGATVVHDEHGPIELPAGSYAVVNQQEFDGLRWRQVYD